MSTHIHTYPLIQHGQVTTLRTQDNIQTQRQQHNTTRKTNRWRDGKQALLMPSIIPYHLTHWQNHLTSKTITENPQKSKKKQNNKSTKQQKKIKNQKTSGNGKQVLLMK